MVIGESTGVRSSPGRHRLRSVTAGIPPAWLGIIELTCGMATIAAGFLASDIITESLPVMLASTVRYLIATLVLLPVLLLSGRVPRFSRTTWWTLLAVALGGTLIFNSGLLYGLRYTTIIEAGIVTSTTPLLVGLFGLLFFRERLSGRSWLAILAATSGVFLVVVQPADASGETVGTLVRLGGLLLILMAASGEAAFNVFGRRLPRSVSSIAASTATMAIAIVLFLPGAVVEVVTGPGIPADRDGWLAVVFMGLIPSALGVLLWADGVRRVSLAVSGAATALIPVFTSLMAVAIVGERLQAVTLIGILLIVVSLAFLARWSVQDGSGLP
ncbi:MAG: Permease of the drug/metabolite transporter (DMT) superfamily [uncultured Thermomicrobiales bacterium]|uniref:Permease of the drug/metabolite transporter (DMT) superfamily n=1 Tax=uncultured Thermomicrobiales bacterium TaxID=1645740 RepID=A0A6J4UJP8_9BACT|nr:MAG: Permease of the drug/metabolite transporter (DMT) superfamily [uncultured Thermomicrobiales bacterium]